MSSRAQRNSSDPYQVNSLIIGPEVDPTAGTVRYDASRSLWNGGIFGRARLRRPMPSPGTPCHLPADRAVTLCAGHSVGFHRRLIHRSFDCPKWLERTLVVVGTPSAWAAALDHPPARQPRLGAAPARLPLASCAHAKGCWLTGLHLHCRLALERPARLRSGTRYRRRSFLSSSSSAPGCCISCRSDPLPAGRLALGRLGRVRPRRRLHHHALVHLLLRPYARPAGLARRWRGDPGP